MNRKLLLFTLLAAMTLAAAAQPKFAKKVQKGIVSVNTYDRQGNLLHQGTAFYVGANGEAIADYAVFKGAARAVVIDAQGKQAEVDCVLGADDTYSLVRFSVSTKGNAVLPMAKGVQPKGTTLYALGYAAGAEAGSDVSAVADTAMISGKYVYYALGKTMDDKLIGCPVFNAGGELVGVLHAPIGDKSHVMDIRFKDELQMAAIPTRSASAALANIFLPKGLPDSAEEALVYVYFKSQNTTNEEYMDIVNRFVGMFPKNAEGYRRRATPLIDLHRFDEAESDLQTYLSLTADKVQGNLNVASIIFDKLDIMPEPAYDKWTYDAALAYAEKAAELNEAVADAQAKQQTDEAVNVLKTKIFMAQKRYDEAIGLYEKMFAADTTRLTYLYAISLAKGERGDSLAEVIAPLDRAIELMGEPMPTGASAYVLRRGQLYANAGKYRDAVKEYNQYCYINSNQVSAVFYFERAQLETNARMFQQALTDYNKAIEMAPQRSAYHLERAAMCIRVGLLDECIESCQTVIKLSPDVPDAYRILGYALIQKGDKTAARQHLQKAVDMGDENAKVIMETYL